MFSASLLNAAGASKDTQQNVRRCYKSGRCCFLRIYAQGAPSEGRGASAHGGNGWYATDMQAFEVLAARLDTMAERREAEDYEAYRATAALALRLARAERLGAEEHIAMLGPDQMSQPLSSPQALQVAAEARRAAEAALLYNMWAECDCDLTRLRRQDGQPIPARILVVGDAGLQQLALRSALESMHYGVEVTSDGLQAVRIIRHEGYDLVLVDDLISGIDGLAIGRLMLNLMREDARPRVVVLSPASGGLAVAQLEIGSSCDEIVTKSADLSALLVVVDRQLRLSGSRTIRPVVTTEDSAARSDIAGRPHNAETVTAPSHTDHHILLVDDAADVLVTAGAFLAKEGFAVEKAPNGDEALSLISRNPKIDVLVTDFAMPGLSGVELIAQAVQIRPNLRAIVITGYPNADGLAELPPNTTILAKPFRRASLIGRIQSLLDEMQPVSNETAALVEDIDVNRSTVSVAAHNDERPDAQ